jgi:VWFA-related protein
VRRVPANVLLALDTGGDLNPAMRASITRDIATKLISTLQSGDRIAALQFGNKLELLQSWTTNKNEVVRALETQLISGKRPQLAKALAAAALQLSQVPAGTRHLVLITDGVDLSHDDAALTEALTQLLERNITVHVIGYGSLGRKTIDQQNPLVKITNTKRKSAQDLAQEIMDPTAIPEYKKRNKIYLIFDTDFERRKTLESYKDATKLSEVWLTSLAQATGGLVFMPGSVKDMIPPAEEIAREIDSQYVITYTPKRPLAQATPGEYRRIFVASRAAGMSMRARPGYVVTGP